MLRMTPEAVVGFLAHTALLEPCGTQVLGKLAPHVDQRKIPKGQPLLPRGASPASGVTARRKILSDLDITEKRIPQHRRIGASVGKRDLNE